MENEHLYDSFIAEVNRNIFLSIGQAMEAENDKYKEDIDKEDKDKEDKEDKDKIKSYEEICHEYLTKLDHKIDSLLYKQEQLLEKINILTLENNVTLENMKTIKAKLQNKPSSFVTMITSYLAKEDLERQHNEATEQYCNVFDIITRLHEEVLEIEEQIKNTKGFK
jgi:hypothetical protein